MNFKETKISDILDEAKPLLAKHWEEIAHFKDIVLDPDYDQYIKLEELGITRTFCARTDDGVLIGYAVFFIRPHIHYKTCNMAFQDVLFIHPDHRGIGYFFVKFCDARLQEYGINVVSQHLKAKFDFSTMLKRLGYELMDHIYVKRLN